MKTLRSLAVAAALCLLCAHVVAQPAPVTPAEHRRGPEQTFLTYPEWFLVHSPAEYAVFLRDRSPSAFPYFGHIGQFWQAYAAVYEATKDYPFNAGYHVMIMVIGISTSIEYALKSAYETVIGRLSELSRRHGMTAEDRFAARAAQDYVDFIRVRPWYEYDFVAQLRGLWRDTGWWGRDPVRKWERKYALTTEYVIKAAYGWIIGKLTRMGYQAPLPVTAVLVDRLPPDAATAVSGLQVLAQMGNGPALIAVPRYQAFTDCAIALAKRNVQFLEIAGNRSQILVSVLAPAQWRPPVPAQQVLFIQPILTRPSTQRLALTVAVDRLAETLRVLSAMPVEIEHIYDY